MPPYGRSCTASTRRLRMVGNWVTVLYFESLMAIRRVTEYPPDWWNLATDKLEIVSLRS